MYTIRILDDAEFDKLPYKFVKDSLGLADPETGEAFVRKTGIKEMDMATLSHEVDELVAKTSPHEIDGIRYKKGGALRTILPIVAAFIPGIGPIVSAALNVGMNIAILSFFFTI